MFLFESERCETQYKYFNDEHKSASDHINKSHGSQCTALQPKPRLRNDLLQSCSLQKVTAEFDNVEVHHEDSDVGQRCPTRDRISVTRRLHTHTLKLFGIRQRQFFKTIGNECILAHNGEAHPTYWKHHTPISQHKRHIWSNRILFQFAQDVHVQPQRQMYKNGARVAPCILWKAQAHAKRIGRQVLPSLVVHGAITWNRYSSTASCNIKCKIMETAVCISVQNMYTYIYIYNSTLHLRFHILSVWTCNHCFVERLLSPTIAVLQHACTYEKLIIFSRFQTVSKPNKEAWRRHSKQS